MVGRRFLAQVLIPVLLLSGCKLSEGRKELQNVTVFSGDTQDLVGPQDVIDLVRFFPKILYKVHNVENLGSFYIDNRNDIVKNVLRSGNVWEKEIVDLINSYALPGTTAIDIGSHVGAHTLTMSQRVGKQGKVIAFEPQIKIYAELIMNMILNNCHNVTCYRCAVGEKFDHIEMNPPVIDNEGGTTIGRGGDPSELIPLDYLKLKNVSLIKIDVENTELEVLKGAKQTIMESRPVLIVEIMGNIYDPIPNRQERIREVLDFIEKMGYQLSYIQGSWSDWLAVPKNGDQYL